MGAPVHVVLCMDTEGPCDDPANAELLPDWEAVDAAMDKLFHPGFRAQMPDSDGGLLRVGWFFLTWTGFTTNPRKRDFGYHRVRDHYLARWGTQLDGYGDEQCWHYHHPPASGIGNAWGLDWTVSEEYAAILSRQILERSWFPACFRAGGTILTPASSRWVDAWFPVDYSNRAPLALPGLVDWSSGVAEWTVYHPHPEDFRCPGPGRRRLARCLDLATDVYAIKRSDVVAAFERARSGEPAVLAVFDHDYRDIAARVDGFRELVADVAAEYSDVPWRYAAPTEAVRCALGAHADTLELEVAAVGRGVEIRSSAPLFQSLPWLAVQDGDDSVQHVVDDIVRVDATRWRWRPSSLRGKQAAVAGSTDLGATAVALVPL